LRSLGPIDDQTRGAAFAGIGWLLDLQNRDGGVPTFCRGWGALPFDRSSADITAHAVRAWLAWANEAPLALRRRLDAALGRAVRFLARAQRPDGAWAPLWFGNERAPNEENLTYGTARVLRALAELASHRGGAAVAGRATALLEKGAGWLLSAQNADGSWSACPQCSPSVEETALAIEALTALLRSTNSPHRVARERLCAAVTRGAAWLVERVESGEWQQPAPIGFYFAKLWYYERLYPLIFTVGALGEVLRAAVETGSATPKNEACKPGRLP
jgi:squalene-hopene/tetraprenyl-beta-curcumene cyclase